MTAHEKTGIDPAMGEEQIEAIKFWYDGWLHDRHRTADTILCQQIGQILGLPVKEGLQCPLPQRLRDAADAIAELNAMQGLNAERCGVSPKYLREEADKMEMTG